MKTRDLIGIITRYVLAIFFVFILPVFYFIFRPLTSWLFVLLLSIFHQGVFVMGNVISFNSSSIVLIDACIAGSAYLLLLLLNLLTPKISIKKRVLLFIFSSVIFLIINVFRLLITSFFIGSEAFNSVHMTFWFLSVVFVVGIWFLSVIVFRIKEVPVYSDIIKILRELRNRKN
jgi:hypothetical protein